MQSKVVLTVSLVLIILPSVIFFFFDFADYPMKERILRSVFQAVTPRTAGFNTADFSLMTGPGRMIIILDAVFSPGVIPRVRPTVASAEAVSKRQVSTGSLSIELMSRAPVKVRIR